MEEMRLEELRRSTDGQRWNWRLSAVASYLINCRGNDCDRLELCCFHSETTGHFLFN